MWKPEPEVVSRWKEIPLETYKFLFERSKEKFEEILSDSETITDRSLHLFYAFTVFLSGIIGVVAKESSQGLSENFFPLLVLCIVDFTLLIYLFMPREMATRGSHPKDIFNPNLFEDEQCSAENKKSIIYYHEIIRLQQGIDINKSSNKIRQKVYFCAFIVSTILFLFTVWNIISVIYRP